MPFYDICQLAIPLRHRYRSSRFVLVGETPQQFHDDLQLATDVDDEDGGQAARAYRDRVKDEARGALHEEHDLVHRAALDVQ